jgi:hypothetical protein
MQIAQKRLLGVQRREDAYEKERGSGRGRAGRGAPYIPTSDENSCFGRHCSSRSRTVMLPLDSVLFLLIPIHFFLAFPPVPLHLCASTCRRATRVLVSVPTRTSSRPSVCPFTFIISFSRYRNFSISSTLSLLADSLPSRSLFIFKSCQMHRNTYKRKKIGK